MNVVEQWRDRARALRGMYWTCGQCGRFAAVRRASCTGCGKPMTNGKRALLPRSFRAVGTSQRHTVVETMDQESTRGTAMLVESESGQLFAFLLAEGDVPHAAQLVGETLEQVVRRKSAEIGPYDPIVYTRKLAARISTRLKLKKSPKPEG